LIRTHYILGEIKEADALMKEAGGNQLFLKSVQQQRAKFIPKFKFNSSSVSLKRFSGNWKEIPQKKLEYPSASQNDKNPLLKTFYKTTPTPASEKAK